MTDHQLSLTDLTPPAGEPDPDAAAVVPQAEAIIAEARAAFTRLDALGEQLRIDTINVLAQELSSHSPLKEQPTARVVWVPAEQVRGNAYNPNVVAGPEMELLTLSIKSDGYTQPIVVWQTGTDADGAPVYEVVDGYHRHRVGKEDDEVRTAVHGRLPVVIVNAGRTDKADRMAATVRHNRARGLHTVTGMSEIVMELARLRWPDERIGHELGMDPDEVTRLRQVTGIAELFTNDEFSEAWEPTTSTPAPAARLRPDPLPEQKPVGPPAEGTGLRIYEVSGEYTVSYDGVWLPGIYETRDACLVALGAVLSGEKLFQLDDLQESAVAQERTITVSDFTDTAHRRGRTIGIDDVPGDFADQDARLVAYGVLLAGGGTFDPTALPAPVTVAAIEAAA
ncbi:IbrB-like domain-containing protein [Kitasatospora purpeofusca]|uniref:IbrB-like domain-containing protein n=1 Tax=Kitasatospora purpeofusca TaxID=67352 RepID=UPI0035E155FA